MKTPKHLFAAALFLQTWAAAQPMQSAFCEIGPRPSVSDPLPHDTRESAPPMSTITVTAPVLEALNNTITANAGKLRYEEKKGCFTANGNFNWKKVPTFGAARVLRPKAAFANKSTIGFSGRVEAVGLRVLDNRPVHRFNVNVGFSCTISNGRLVVKAGKPRVTHIGNAILVDIAGNLALKSVLTGATKTIAALIEAELSAALRPVAGIVLLRSITFEGKSVTFVLDVK